jgi:hypothetical protein
MRIYTTLLTLGLLLLGGLRVEAQDAASQPAKDADEAKPAASDTEPKAEEPKTPPIPPTAPTPPKKPEAAPATKDDAKAKSPESSSKSSDRSPSSDRRSGRKSSHSTERAIETAPSAPAAPRLESSIIKEKVLKDVHKATIEAKKALLKSRFPVAATDPDLAEYQNADLGFEHACQELADRIRVAENPTVRDQLLDRLKTVVNEHFDLRQKRRESEVQKLEEQLERLRKSTQQRADARESIIKQRIAVLTGVQEEPGF